jgi:hypothetical protein
MYTMKIKLILIFIFIVSMITLGTMHIIYISNKKPRVEGLKVVSDEGSYDVSELNSYEKIDLDEYNIKQDSNMSIFAQNCVTNGPDDIGTLYITGRANHYVAYYSTEVFDKGSSTLSVHRETPPSYKKPESSKPSPPEESPKPPPDPTAYPCSSDYTHVPSGRVFKCVDGQYSCDVYSGFGGYCPGNYECAGGKCWVPPAPYIPPPPPPPPPPPQTQAQPLPRPPAPQPSPVIQVLEIIGNPVARFFGL